MDHGQRRPAWKGRTPLGTGAAFAQAKDVTAMAIQVESIVIRRSTQVTPSAFPIFLGARLAPVPVLS